jgi:cytochrome c556
MKTACAFFVLALVAPILLPAVEDPPPQHVQWMKESGQLQDKIRNGQDVAASAQRLAAIYKEVEVFWAARKSDVAVKAARDIQAAAAKVAAGDASAGRAIGAGCRSCHDQHREKISDTVYKIK